MKGWRRSRWAWARAALVAALLAVSAGVATAQQSAADEIAASQRRLDQIRHEQGELRDEMARIRSRVSDLASEVGNLDRQVGTSEGLLEELGRQIGQRERQAAINARELLHTRDLLIERKAVLNRRLRDIYKRGPLQTMEVLLTAKSFSDLIDRYRYLQIIARHDRRLADEVARLEGELSTRERGLRTNLRQLETIQQERSREYQQLETLRREQQRALSSARAREQTTSARIEQLEQDEARLSALLTELERRRREAEAAAAARAEATPAAPSSALSPADRGAVPWPLEGRVIYPFGREVQPNGTAIRRNGIGIGAPAGTPVRAAVGGNVVLAGPFEGYGPTVVLNHGGGYYTLYLYLREVGVREGQAIAAGEVIGGVGGDAASASPHIEFQIRGPGGEAVDPIPWLRNR